MQFPFEPQLQELLAETRQIEWVVDEKKMGNNERFEFNERSNKQFPTILYDLLEVAISHTPGSDHIITEAGYLKAGIGFVSKVPNVTTV
jgi:hypothetical protein